MKARAWELCDARRCAPRHRGARCLERCSPSWTRACLCFHFDDPASQVPTSVCDGLGSLLACTSESLSAAFTASLARPVRRRLMELRQSPLISPSEAGTSVTLDLIATMAQQQRTDHQVKSQVV